MGALDLSIQLLTLSRLLLLIHSFTRSFYVPCALRGAGVLVVNKLKPPSSQSLLSREIRERLKTQELVDPRERTENGRGSNKPLVSQ